MFHIYATDRASNLAQKIQNDLRNPQGGTNTPEENIKAKVVDVITAALHGFEPNTEVQVEVNANLSPNGQGGRGQGLQGAMTIKVQQVGWDQGYQQQREQTR